MSNDETVPGTASGARPRRPPPLPEHLRLYSDTPYVEVAVEIDASPDRIWPFVSDINLPARFSDEFVGAEWVSDKSGLGATFVGHSRHPDLGTWQATCTVTRYEENAAFEWTVGDVERPSARWRFEIEARPGGCRLTQWAQMGPARSGLSRAIDRMPDKERRIVARRLEEWIANMTANLEGIKRHVEAQT